MVQLIEVQRLSGKSCRRSEIPLRHEGGRTAFYPSDLVPTVSHLPYPYIMGYDVLPLTTLETKKRVLPRALREGWKLCLVHEPVAPFGVLREERGRIVFVPEEGQ